MSRDCLIFNKKPNINFNAVDSFPIQFDSTINFDFHIRHNVFFWVLTLLYKFRCDLCWYLTIDYFPFWNSFLWPFFLSDKIIEQLDFRILLNFAKSCKIFYYVFVLITITIDLKNFYDAIIFQKMPNCKDFRKMKVYYCYSGHNRLYKLTKSEPNCQKK